MIDSVALLPFLPHFRVADKRDMHPEAVSGFGKKAWFFGDRDIPIELACSRLLHTTAAVHLMQLDSKANTITHCKPPSRPCAVVGITLRDTASSE